MLPGGPGRQYHSTLIGGSEHAAAFSRSGLKILDHNLDCLIRQTIEAPRVLDDLVQDLHDHPKLVPQQIVSHLHFGELVYGVLRIMDFHTPQMPRIAGNAAYVLGAMIDNDKGRTKVFSLLENPARLADTQHFLPNLGALIEIEDLEAMTNASGTVSLIFESETGQSWALNQPSCEWLLFILARSLLNTDMWVASNCALSLARVCMSEEGRAKVMTNRDLDFIICQLISSLGVDKEGRGMNAAFALAHICDVDVGINKVAYLKECLDMNLGLMNMIMGEDEGCKKNACFCLKTMTSWSVGQQRIIDDPDVGHLLKQLNGLLTGEDEELSRMASIVIKNLATSKDGYMLLKDLAFIRSTLEHVLSQMSISDLYREDALATQKEILIPQPSAPELTGIDANSVIANWSAIEAKSGAEVNYELYCGSNIVYTGPKTSFTCRNLTEKTEYDFDIRAYTHENEESLPSEKASITTTKLTSSPPRNMRAVSVTGSSIKIKWDAPTKLCGTLKGYYLESPEQGIRYEPVCQHHIASNLEPDKEYTFHICAATTKGRGETATISVRTLRSDYFSPTKPQLMTIGPFDIVCTWKSPVSPQGRINGYEVMCDGKSIYFGMNKRCVATMLQSDTKYKFTVVAWTNEGRSESLPTHKKTAHINAKKKKREKSPWKNKKEMMEWLDSTDTFDLATIDGNLSDDGDADASDASTKKSPRKSDAESEDSANSPRKYSEEEKSRTKRQESCEEQDQSSGDKLIEATAVQKEKESNETK